MNQLERVALATGAAHGREIVQDTGARLTAILAAMNAVPDDPADPAARMRAQSAYLAEGETVLAEAEADIVTAAGELLPEAQFIPTCRRRLIDQRHQLGAAIALVEAGLG